MLITETKKARKVRPLFYLGINSMWKQKAYLKRGNARRKVGIMRSITSIRCATKRIKARPAALTTRLCVMHAKSEAYDT